jgi:hypothetical protein
MIIISKYFVPKNYLGITIFPFIFLKKKSLKGNKTIINHERIHLKQQVEMLWILFFIWYGIEFLIKLTKYRNWNIAYKNISFEKEAYENEHNVNYLKNRKLFSFLKYL